MTPQKSWQKFIAESLISDMTGTLEEISFFEEIYLNQCFNNIKRRIITLEIIGTLLNLLEKQKEEYNAITESKTFGGLSTGDKNVFINPWTNSRFTVDPNETVV